MVPCLVMSLNVMWRFFCPSQFLKILQVLCVYIMASSFVFLWASCVCTWAGLCVHTCVCTWAGLCVHICLSSLFPSVWLFCPILLCWYLFYLILLFFFFFFFFLVFQDRISLCNPDCPLTHSVDQAGLELRNLPASGHAPLLPSLITF
jgi:hypothetical protein